jgi:hypothetical protein
LIEKELSVYVHTIDEIKTIKNLQDCSQRGRLGILPSSDPILSSTDAQSLVGMEYGQLTLQVGLNLK